eukprot:scaffold27618_cov16-Tisochrysis_lutea.AAC.1
MSAREGQGLLYTNIQFALLRRLLSTLIAKIRHGLLLVTLLIPIDFFLVYLGEGDTQCLGPRLSPNDWATAREFGWAELKRSIEELQEINGGRKVILAGISMGSTYINAFLHSMVTEEWKASNIAGFFSISGEMSQSREVEGSISKNTMPKLQASDGRSCDLLLYSLQPL